MNKPMAVNEVDTKLRQAIAEMKEHHELNSDPPDDDEFDGYTDEEQKMWNETHKMQTTLAERLAAVDSRLVALATKVEMAARPAAAPQRGPDPNKVYQVRTDVAPSEGPRTAPVVIAEFSDFQ